MLAKLIESQRRWSAAFDRRLPASYSLDGNQQFQAEIVPRYLAEDLNIYDFGGGKNPTLHREEKEALRCRLTGVDISPGELARAPEGTYDHTLVADIGTFRGEAGADLIISRALLEHVQDIDGAFLALATTLKPGGKALVFVPSRNAVFARLNLLLPQSWKRALLFAIFPDAARDQGFPAYYRKCTPKDFEAMAQAVGLRVEARWLYFSSGYFTFCFPLHLLWRVWMALFRWAAPIQSAETFTMVLTKPEAGAL